MKLVQSLKTTVARGERREAISHQFDLAKMESQLLTIAQQQYTESLQKSE